MGKCTERLYNGIVKENPTFVQMLGMCPTLAVTSSAINGAGMGLSTTCILVLSNAFISLLRKVIPEKVRIILYCYHCFLCNGYSVFNAGISAVLK